MNKTLAYTLTEDDLPATDDGLASRVLTECLHLSRHEISHLKFDGEILLNGEKIRVTEKMKPGDVLTVVFPEEVQERVEETEEEPDILLEEEDFVIVNKPAGIPVHPGHGHLNDSMGTILMSHYQKQNENFVIRPVGRLDKDVTGAVLYAKNQPAAARLSRQRDEGKLTKQYIAFAEGIFEKKKGQISLPLQKVDGKKQREVGEDGKEAVTHYRVLKQLMLDGIVYSCLKVTIETGRTHQIRAHLSAVGHPLLGDEMYHGNMELIRRPALHCFRISMLSPFTLEAVQAEADLYDDMKYLLDAGKPLAMHEEPFEPAVTEEKHPVWKVILRVLGVLLLFTLICLAGFYGYQTIQNRKSSAAEELKEEQKQIYASDYLRSHTGILTVEGDVDSFKEGDYSVVYTLHQSDSTKNDIARSYERIFTVADTIPPVIVLKEQTVSIENGSDYDPMGNIVSVTDSKDGELTAEIETDLNTSEEGDYLVKVKAADATGNSSETQFTVAVGQKKPEETQTAETPPAAVQPADLTAPVITLYQDQAQITEGDRFAASDYLQSVWDETDGTLPYSDTAEAGTYTIVSDVSSQPGNYTVVFKAMDRAMNQSEAYLYVSVSEKEKEVQQTPQEIPEPAQQPVIITGETPQLQVMNFLMDQMGLSKALACGIMSNMARESGFDPTALNPWGYYGLCQWGGPRLENLYSWCGENGYDPETMSGQLAFLAYELPNFYPNTFAQMSAVPDTAEGAAEAARVFALGYEVGGYDDALLERAKQYFETY